MEVKENIDWFDIHAKIRFGEYEISFKELRKLILKKKVEFKLPNGEIAIIPEAWLIKYGDLFAMSETHGDHEKPVLKKHHINLLRELEEGNLAKVHMSERLRNLQSFSGIKDYPLPEKFVGTLRPYQKAGYNWLRFLNEFHLGGCLADDMGLGKTVQTLALLQAEKERGNAGTSLLIMPTSLIYNWEMEASKFKQAAAIGGAGCRRRVRAVAGAGGRDGYPCPDAAARAPVVARLRCDGGPPVPNGCSRRRLLVLGNKHRLRRGHVAAIAG